MPHNFVVIGDGKSHVKDTITCFLTIGLSVDSLLKSSWTGLMYAANNGLPDVVALLIERGANVNYQKGLD